MKKPILIVAVVLFGILSASAQQAKYIGMKRAKAIAMQRVKGTIKSSELEKEHGKMIYSFDIRNLKGSITEVNIDAKTGKIIAVDVENARDEAREKKEEMKEKKKP
jgi:tRNA(Glu) U13 pseudouridine synthase TruD